MSVTSTNGIANPNYVPGQVAPSNDPAGVAFEQNQRASNPNSLQFNTDGSRNPNYQPEVASNGIVNAPSWSIPGLTATNSYSQPQPVSPTMDASQVGNANPLNVPNPAYTTPSGAFTSSLPDTTASSTSTSTTPAEPTWKDYIRNKYGSILDKLGGEGDAYKAEQEKYQVPENTMALAQLNGVIAQRRAAYLSKWQQAEGEAVPTPFIAGEQTQIQRTEAVEMGVLTAQAQALSGNIQAANDIIDKTIQHEFEPLKAQLTGLAQFYNMNQNDLTDSEKLKLQNNYDLMKFSAENLFNAKKEVYANLAANNAPADVVQKATQATDLNSLYQVTGIYGQPQQTDIVNANGRQLLVNKRTGVTIKDLGSAPLNSYTYASTPDGQSLITALNTGKISPNQVNSKTAPILGKLFSQNPNFNATQANAAADFWTAKSTQEKLAWASTTEKDFATLKSLSDSVPRTDWPLVNKALLAGEMSIAGNPRATAYVQAASRVAASLSNVLGDSGGSDFRTQLANGVLNPAFSSKTFDTVLNTESSLIGNLTTSFRETGGQTGSSQTSTPQNTQGESFSINGLQVTLPNGKIWTAPNNAALEAFKKDYGFK